MFKQQLSESDMQRLDYLLNEHGDRTAFYLHSYELTGNQVFLQMAQISHFTGFSGHTAETANHIVQQLHPENYPQGPSLDGQFPTGGAAAFSEQVAHATLTAMQNDIQHGGTGILTERETLDAARSAWEMNKLGDQYPANIIMSGHIISEGSLIALAAGAEQVFLGALKDDSQFRERIENDRYCVTEDSKMGFYIDRETGRIDAAVHHYVTDNPIYNKTEWATGNNLHPALPEPEATGVINAINMHNDAKLNESHPNDAPTASSNFSPEYLEQLKEDFTYSPAAPEVMSPDAIAEMLEKINNELSPIEVREYGPMVMKESNEPNESKPFDIASLFFDPPENDWIIIDPADDGIEPGYDDDDGTLGRYNDPYANQVDLSTPPSSENIFSITPETDRTGEWQVAASQPATLVEEIFSLMPASYKNDEYTNTIPEPSIPETDIFTATPPLVTEEPTQHEPEVSNWGVGTETASPTNEVESVWHIDTITPSADVTGPEHESWTGTLDNNEPSQDSWADSVGRQEQDDGMSI